MISIIYFKNLKVLRSKRDNIAVNEALGKLSNGAKNNKYNLLQLSIEASRKRATVGEISYALEKVFKVNISILIYFHVLISTKWS